ncbi:MAG: 30S ribosomal protein S8 [Nitrospiraceae bacterium]|nr:30S ribosomal protein S8 [Nitrospiraceae bacterium]
MSMSDPIADLLTRIRNALGAGKTTVDVPASRMKESICAVLKREGFIEDYVLCEPLGDPRCQLRVTLRYTPDHSPVIQGIKRVSKPSLRTYAKYKDLQLVRSGLGISIVSTSQGVMTSKQARSQQIGGEVLCEVW